MNVVAVVVVVGETIGLRSALRTRAFQGHPRRRACAKGARVRASVWPPFHSYKLLNIYCVLFTLNIVCVQLAERTTHIKLARSSFIFNAFDARTCDSIARARSHTHSHTLAHTQLANYLLFLRERARALHNIIYIWHRICAHINQTTSARQSNEV